MTTPPAEEVTNELAHLSDEPYPSRTDIQRVKEVAHSFGVFEDIRRRIRNNSKFRDRFHWVHTHERLKLYAPNTKPIWGAELILKFQHDDWDVGIPRPQTV